MLSQQHLAVGPCCGPKAAFPCSQFAVGHGHLGRTSIQTESWAADLAGLVRGRPKGRILAEIR
jgi:hypothetical protein